MFLSEEEFQQKALEIEKKNESFRRKEELKRRKEYYPRRPSASKIVLAAVIFLCFEIVVFCECMMAVTGDTGALYALIGVPTTLVPIVISYYAKSAKENTAGGIVYESVIGHDESAEG